jgi:cytochrome subunit of sulfide dehydrogenase
MSLMQLLAAMLVLCSAVLILPAAAAAEAVASRGTALANACAACHGPDGRSQGAIPSIDNLPAGNFTMALKAFSTGTRQGTVMNRIAKGLDDAEISATAAYFATRQRR